MYGWMRAWRGREKPPRVLRHFLQLQFNHEENHNKPVPVPEKEPSKRLQKPTPFLPYAVLRGLACQEGANRVLQKQNNRPVPANATRQGDRTKVRIGQLEDNHNRHALLRVCGRGQRVRGRRKKEALYTLYPSWVHLTPVYTIRML